ncbi:MAG TPA: tRNA (adenosine(37)-N6)-dimethylallyltransferase MiaA [Candidatus Limnocylindria bacterium]|nr:tRNA (adenosine(37)-N6)-dimethylallyltransferase MiaA [Candidatus Limnocylindria bacterium]
MRPAPPLLAVVGPTASGKTDLALALARFLPVEILVADSRQVYRGMDIGTAKPSAAARAAVPHHLLDLVPPDAPFSLADWLTAARAAVREVGERGRLPLVVGGTGLYISALVDGYDLAAQGHDPARRASLAAELGERGLAPLVARLTRLDPAAAARIDRRNPRRVLRALERAEAGSVGGPPRAEAYAGPVRLIGLARPRAALVARIEARAHAMFTGGLLDEVRDLRDAGYGPWLEPMTGHGYREAARHLAGEWTLEEAIRVTALHTRQYAKRQLTWFRRDARIRWLDAGDGPADAPELVTAALAVAAELSSGVG